jgi:hypothetical protein
MNATTHAPAHAEAHTNTHPNSSTAGEPVRIYVLNRMGLPSTVNVLPVEYTHMLLLARGAGSMNPRVHVGKIVRQVATDLTDKGYTGRFSPAVRARTVQILRGAYQPAVAAAYDAAQFPDGTEVQS